ncbi:unnamed protein product [Allacma fusca]|uniref:Uncharacterized protein n=1 Tax=Allacma fusca TaxID=39272 RepID=A0A8J2JB63_9HEXA|nr:unnamed protein product [Allacma fusca]
MNLRLVTILLVTVAFQLCQSELHRRSHRRHRIQPENDFKLNSVESREVQNDIIEKSPPPKVIPEDRFGAGNVISIQCHYGTVVIKGNTVCKEKNHPYPPKPSRKPGK